MRKSPLSSARVFCFLLFVILLTAISTQMFAEVHTTAKPQVRVTTPVDNTKRTTLYGHVPAAVRGGSNLGRVDGGTFSEGMILLLKSDEQQKRELRRVLDEQQDKHTANFHQWVTPEQFGAHFGVHDHDVAQVEAWLLSQGFTVDAVSKSKRSIRFSGNVAQIEAAFQTEMHYFLMRNGETHVSNDRDISVPAALSPVIAGVASLNDFFRQSHMVPGGVVPQQTTPIGKDSRMRPGPRYTSSSSVHYVSAADFATIYNTAPLLAAGINGSGIKIGIVGRSDILLSDVETYRAISGLPANDPVFIHAGQDGGVLPGDDGESDLDVEISGGAAPNATIDFVIGTPTFLVDGITNSYEYIIENNLTDILSSSYGDCEANEGSGGNLFNAQMFEQAAAQGISVFIAEGDNGPAGCDAQGSQVYEVLGYASGAEEATWYSVGVGGTEFYGDSNSSYSTYWNSSNASNLSSAIEYIPEYPWNESDEASPQPAPASPDEFEDLWSGSGAISAYYLRPPWQTGSGINNSADPALTLANGATGNWVASVNITNSGAGYTTAPTVTFGSGCTDAPAATSVLGSGATAGQVVALSFEGYADGDHYQGFNCTSVPTITFSAAPSGGTTATATAVLGPMQNLLPLISGVPHRLTPDLSLNAASGHDATIFCSEGVCADGYLGLVGGTSVAAPSMAGVQALIDQANGGRQGMPAYIYYQLANAQNSTLCNSSNNPLNSSNCAFQDVTLGNNFICGAGTYSSSHGGTYTCSGTTTAGQIGFAAGTGYDLATGLGSPNAANLATQWSTVTFNSSNTTLNLSSTSFQHGANVTLSGTVAAGSGNGTPTGDVAFIVSQGAIGDTNNEITGAQNGPLAFTTLSNGSYSATLNNLPGGTYFVTTRYAGDENYASSLSAGVQVTVSSEAGAVTITPYSLNALETGTNPCTITPASTFTYGQDTLINVNVAGASGDGAPTGTVALTLDGNAWTTLTLDPNGNAFVFSGIISSPTAAAGNCIYEYLNENETIPGGTHTIGATYSGDNSVQSASATPASITVSQISPGTLTFSAAGATGSTAAVIASGATVPLAVTFPTVSALTTYQPMPGASGPTGTVTFTDTTTNTVLGTATVAPSLVFENQGSSTSALPEWIYAATAKTSTTGITASGTHSITASYSGDTNFTSASATASVTVGGTTATTVAVTSSANPTTLGGTPTLTATVTTATAGTVTFFDGTTVLGQGSAVGTAHTSTLKISSTYPFVGGTHSITAVYSGTGTTSQSSVSPVFTETVTQGTLTVDLSVKPTDNTGNTFSFAAVLNCPSTGAGCKENSETGFYAFSNVYAPVLSNVNFYDGATLLGSAPATEVTWYEGGYGIWAAQFNTTLSAGSHSITAQYSDTNYASATSGALAITVTGSQTLSWTTAPPASAAYNSSFTVAASASSGLTPAYTSYGSCTNSGATYTITKGTGSCLVIVNQAGNASYGPATELQQSVSATPASQTITFTTNAPASAAYGSSFTVAATGGASGNAVTFTSSGVCTNTGATYTMTSGTGTCSVIANQLGNTYYSAAPTVTQPVNATLATNTVTFTTPPPTSAEYGSLFTVAASGSGTGAITYSSDGTYCTNNGPTYEVIQGGGTCVVGASQAADANYATGSASQNVNTTDANSSVSVTGGGSSVYGQSVLYTATITSDTQKVKGRNTRKGKVKSNTVTGTVVWSSNTGCGTTSVTPGYPGTATCTTSILPVGLSDTVTANYSGDSNHTSASGTESQAVSEASSSISITSVSPSSEDYAADTPVTITAVLSWAGGGSAPNANNVSFSGNGNGTYSAASCGAPSNDTLTCTATYTPTNADTVGTYTENAAFADDGNYTASSATPAAFTINAATTTTAVSSIPNPSNYGQPVTFTATVTAENNFVKGRNSKKGRVKSNDITGTVAWSSNTGCSASAVTWSAGNSNATATCTTSSLAAGTDTITATYSGDSNHNGSSGVLNGGQVVQGTATSINVTNVNPSSEDYAADTPVTITAVLSWAGNGAAPAANVTIGGTGNGTYGSTSCGAASGNQISCTATYTPTTADTAGSYTESASFSGDANYSPSSSPQTNNFTINEATSSVAVASSANPSTYGQPITFTATVSGENGNVKGRAGRKGKVKSNDITGNVTWSANTGCTQSTVSGYPGVATCTTSALNVGSDTVAATYHGDANHSGSSGQYTGEVVNQASSTINVTSVSPNSEDYGIDSPVTITAVLSWSGNGTAPTASDVTIGGNGNGTYGPTSCGSASSDTITCTATYTPTSSDTAGLYTETATFSGDTNYTASSSPQTGNFAINSATSSTSVASTGSPSTYGQSVTFTATITGENNQVKGRAGRRGNVKSNTISGTVTWSSNTGCGTTSVTSGNSGTATCTTSSLNGGTDEVSATYNGDANHGVSTGFFNQVVNPAAATVTFSNLTQTYTGSALSPTVTTTPSGLSCTPTGYPDTNAGSYPVSVTCSNNNYAGSASGTFVINKAAATVALSNLTQTYSGSALSPTVTTTPSGLAITPTNYPDTNAGTYSVTATVNNPNYAGSASGTFVINQASQTIAFTTNPPATAVYGTSFLVAANASSGLTVAFTAGGGCSVVDNLNGTATYTMISGVTACSVIANQAGNGNYSAAKSVTKTTGAQKATPAVSFTGLPSSLPYNSTYTITAANTSPGGTTASITDSTTTVCTLSGTTVTIVSTSKTCTVTATWGPNNNYNSATLSQSGTAKKGVATITWATPAPITYGTGLSATQLDATATPSGIYPSPVYSPELGVVEDAGTVTLKVTYTPNNTTDYATTTDTVLLVVNQAATTTLITSNNQTLTLKNGSATATVDFSVSSSSNPTGKVTLTTTPSGPTCTGTLSSGAGSCKLKFTSTGNWTVTASYPGDKNHTGSTNSGQTSTITVNP